MTTNQVTVNGMKMKPMYQVSEITNRTNKNLWVVFPVNNPNMGVVYSMTFTRDQVRCAGRKLFGTDISNIRSQRVSTYRNR